MTVEEWKRKNPPIQRKPITKADRIRAMTDEELANLLCSIASPHECGFINCHTCIAEKYCKMGHTGFIDWLRQEAKND